MGLAPLLSVGILSGKEIEFTFKGSFISGSGMILKAGSYKAITDGMKISLSGAEGELLSSQMISLDPSSPYNSSFILHNVVIGINFHWERKEDQHFRGSLKLIIENGLITAVNRLSIEDYLVSVISSEMSASATKEFLKAHAVISRSWLLAQVEKSKRLNSGKDSYNSFLKTDDEITRWYDREDHLNFDVCADDHCQRYQGITRASSLLVQEVINETYGEVLTYAGEICDARFYKCCGGVTELFENTWEPVNHPYLQKLADNPSEPAGFDLSLEDEINAIKWISSEPEAFCNTNNKKILSQVLNDYDQETNDFYRWKVEYGQSELSELVKERTGISFGTITDMVPLERGTSGRIIRLKIIGTEKTMILGRELEIRKALSESHLYSSCFYVEKKAGGKEVKFILHGAGWGHGVGLCQIGAAVMGDRGYDYKQILMHYFRGARLQKRY